MGLDNKVTAARYQTIKNYCDEQGCCAQDDRMVGKIFGVGVTVVKTIRNTRDYDEYLATIKRWHGKQTKRRKAGRKVVMPSSGLALEEIPVVMIKRPQCSLRRIDAMFVFAIIVIGVIVLCLLMKGA